MLKRLFDIVLSAFALLCLGIPMLIVVVLVKLTSRGPVFFWSDRIGRNNAIFRMPKFRTMRTDTPVVATHLLTNPTAYLTPIGRVLRKTSIDELPQIYSILVGDMSIVGPRPALFNQDDLIALRTEKGVHELRPGLTGYAQIKGRDDIEIPEKVALDEYYLKNMSLGFDIKIIIETALAVFQMRNVKH